MIDYLIHFKLEAKRQKDEKKIVVIHANHIGKQPNREAKKKSKQNIKFEYRLVYTNEEGQVHELTPEEFKNFKKTSSEYQKIYQLMKSLKKLDSERQPPKIKLEKMANKIMAYF